jgi:hypothetical protein
MMSERPGANIPAVWDAPHTPEGSPGIPEKNMLSLWIINKQI